uniref:G-protein coupled receptors family 1 profile domain-containing protein n=1 Tax=Plectus sambesii TaxID=2011161 RepID=A0A914XNV9_9BILA
MLIILAISTVIYGLRIFLQGSSRLQRYAEWPNVQNDTTILECLLPSEKSAELHLQICSPWSATIKVAIGLERTIAVFLPLYYKGNFRNTHRIALIVGSLLLVVIPLMAFSLNAALNYGSLVVKSLCSSSDVLGSSYADFHRAVVVFGNMIGFILTSAAYLAARRKSGLAGAHGIAMRKEVKRINSLLMMTFLEVVLVAIPQCLQWLSSRGLFTLPSFVGRYVFVLFCTTYLFEIIVYAYLMRQFREQLFNLLTLNRLRIFVRAKCFGVVDVHPMQNSSPYS